MRPVVVVALHEVSDTEPGLPGGRTGVRPYELLAGRVSEGTPVESRDIARRRWLRRIRRSGRDPASGPVHPHAARGSAVEPPHAAMKKVTSAIPGFIEPLHYRCRLHGVDTNLFDQPIVPVVHGLLIEVVSRRIPANRFGLRRGCV